MSRKHLGGGSRLGELPVTAHRGRTDKVPAGGHRAMSPGAQGTKPESEQRGFDGEDQGWAFCPFRRRGLWWTPGKGGEHGGDCVRRDYPQLCDHSHHGNKKSVAQNRGSMESTLTGRSDHKFLPEQP